MENLLRLEVEMVGVDIIMITIVPAFYDIGRGEWTPDKGLPHYLHRTNQTYLQRFGHMAKLENPMVVFTSKEFVNDIKYLPFFFHLFLEL